MKDYDEFKAHMLEAQRQLNEEGIHIELKRWQKLSTYQKNRYKPEHVYPEVWSYRNDQGIGAVVNGEEIDGDIENTKRLLTDYLY